MKHTRRSVWPERFAEYYTTRCRKPRLMRGRPRGMSQHLWFWLTPERELGMVHGKWAFPANGWRGGRERCKPRKTRYSLYQRGVRIGGVDQFQVDGQWIAWIDDGNGCAADERRFGRRCRAKRWVEAHPRRQRPEVRR